MILEADEKMKIGGKEYKVRFTVKSIFNLEKELGESLLVTLGRLQNGVTIPLHTVYSLLRWGLAGGGTVLSDDELDNLFTQLMAEGKSVLYIIHRFFKNFRAYRAWGASPAAGAVCGIYHGRA